MYSFTIIALSLFTGGVAMNFWLEDITRGVLIPHSQMCTLHCTYVTESFLGLGNPPQLRAIIIWIKQSFVSFPVFSVKFLNQGRMKVMRT